ncbi:TetR/AcrR family transcriptional regulator [Dactylosporangium sp. NPDC051485]|uniref:TetR/AcrR family transcriptional regulator n=1 Tax=Dactylosporangium sp. NPDC051485 TaxID=3154846 RepID=UPI003424D7EA
MATTPNARRADAQRNRDAILAAAIDALSESGEVSLNAIAKRAGIGNATLYRNFPTRESLILAVYRREVQHVAESAAELLATHPAEQALRIWIGRLARYAMTKQGLAGALRTAAHPGDDLFAETYQPIVTALAVLLTAAETAGIIQPGLDPDDVLLLFAGLWQLDPAGDWEAQAGRLFELAMRGIRAR